MANEQILVKGSLGVLTSLLVEHGPMYMGIGTGDAGQSTDQTGLQNETTSAAVDNLGRNIRTLAILSQETTDEDNDTFIASAEVTWDEDAKTITEIGLFTTDGAAESPNPPSGGVLFASVKLETPLTFDTGDKATFTISVKYGL